MSGIAPVIDDTTFAGSDKGLPVPLQRTSAKSFALRIANLDHADPPAPYRAGGVPRTPGFNANVLVVTADPKMPKIKVACDVIGFDPVATKIMWRLQTLYVVGRYKKVSGGATPHYRSRVLSVGDTWTGESSAAAFTLFGDDANVLYDNISDRIAGGHAILTVAAKPTGSDVWLQDYVHLRIVGTNPTETIVRKYVHNALAQRDGNIECMADAVFAWENAMQQFDPAVRTHTSYRGVRFNWPQDPADMPSVAFDYGIGLGQFTHPGQETVGVCWDWRDNLDAGMNELLDDLRSTFAAGRTFLAWAINAWSMYNTGSAGSSAYATRLAKSDDGRKIAVDAPPSGFDHIMETAHVVGRPPPSAPRPWPVTETPAPAPVASPHLEEAANAIVASVGDRVTDPQMLAWMWPKIEHEVVRQGGYDRAPTFPGLHESGITQHLAYLDRSERERATDIAFAHLWSRAQFAPAKAKSKRVARGPAGGKGAMRKRAAVAPESVSLQDALLSVPGNLSGEFNSLIPVVRLNVDGGIGGWTRVRERMFNLFGAKGNAGAAIPRINAYYGKLIAAGFPPAPSSTSGRDTPVHPVLKQKLDRAASLLQGDPAALKFGDIGGFSIRNNANNAALLSNHSFGWAVDLDPELNPNISKANLPLAVMEALTGLDLYGPVSLALRVPRPFTACLPDVKQFTEASTALVGAYGTLATLKAAAGRSIARTTGHALNATQLDSLFAAAAQSQSALRQALVAASLSTTQAAAVSKWLLAAVQLFAVKQRVTEPAVTGNAGTVARFGFCNLSAELIAALVASDGGKLNWLGAALGTKDFMHFDLRDEDQPRLVG